MDIKKSILSRFAVVYILFVLFGMAVIGKIVHIQIVEGSELKEARQKQSKTAKIPKRGDIYSRNGNVLACSVPEYVVYFDYRIPAFKKDNSLFVNNVEALAAGLAKLFAHEGTTKKEYHARLLKAAKNNSYTKLHKKPINYSTLMEIKKLPILKEGPYKGGLLVDVRNSRVYPYGNIARRTIGTVRVGNWNGITGLERAYDEYLYGKKQSLNYDSSLPDDSKFSETNGYDIVTTIDTEIQSVANEELLKALSQYKATWGCAVVMEVKTGEILAMSNLSKSAQAKDTNYYEFENYAVTFRGDPGSTIKLPSLMIALEDNYVQLDDTIDTGRGHARFVHKGVATNVYDWNYKTHGGFRKLSVQEVFANSSNIGVSKIMYNNYVATNKEWDYIYRLKNMGFGKPSGIDLVNERASLIKDPSMTNASDKQKWEGGTLIQMSYGYDIEVTPLQMLVFYNAVANNGKMMKPFLVKEIRNASEIALKNQPKIINNKISSEKTIRQAKLMLESVVNEGTAKNIKNKYYKIAGKTGTAQTFVENKYDDKILRASFCGYFPADKPKYSCIIVMQSALPDEPYRVSGGAAASVFKKISDRIYFNDHELRNELFVDTGRIAMLPSVSNGFAHDFNVILNRLAISQTHFPQTQWVQTKITNSSIDYVPLLVDDNTTPNLRGMGMRDALYVAEKVGYKVVCKGYGRVKTQSISPGGVIKKGETIVLVFN